MSAAKPYHLSLAGADRPARPKSERVRPEQLSGPVTTRTIHPYGRRLGKRMEERARELFADGKSEREVAKILGVGNGTAHRLKIRSMSAVTAPVTQRPQSAPVSATVTPISPDKRLEEREARLLAELAKVRDQIANRALNEKAGVEIADMLMAIQLAEPTSPVARQLQGRLVSIIESAHQKLARS